MEVHMHNWTDGYFALSGWMFFSLVIGTTQLTIMGVTIYLHRTMAHRALELGATISHIFRFWLWATTGMVEKEWVATHRKHHAKVEDPEDPHSPVQKGLWHILLFGVWYYKKEAINPQTLEDYGHWCKNDWVERKIYSSHPMLGLMLLLGTYFLLFGWKGVVLWVINVLWIPIHAAGIINGVGHWARGAGSRIFLYQNWVDGEAVPLDQGGRKVKYFGMSDGVRISFHGHSGSAVKNYMRITMHSRHRRSFPESGTSSISGGQSSASSESSDRPNCDLPSVEGGWDLSVGAQAPAFLFLTNLLLSIYSDI
jgi:hypothetical protein